MFDGNDFWYVLWSAFWVFAFIAYLFALFSVIVDLFGDHKLSGWWKAVWVLFLVFVPFLTVLVYLIARGRGMQERAELKSQQSQSAMDEYIRRVAHSPSPADEITKARALADNGTISEQEYEALKARALRDSTPAGREQPVRDRVDAGWQDPAPDRTTGAAR